MKKTLGSLILFLSVSLFGSSLVEYDFKVSNYKPFIKEPVEIEFSVLQIDKKAVMFFELQPHKNRDFELQLVDKIDSKKSYHQSQTLYRYKLFPLKSGMIKLDFDFKVLEASDEAVEKFYTGNRDVINPMATKDTDIVLKPLIFDVQDVQKDVKLFGDYQLHMELIKTEISSMEQLNISYLLEGEGYRSTLEKLLPEIEGVEQFLEVQRSKNGKEVFQYALFSSSDFIVPAVEIKCFSPSKKQYYTLKTPAKTIKVSSIDMKSLLDEKESYPSTAFNWGSLLPYLNGFLLMLAGFIIAKLNLLDYFKKPSKERDPMHQKIKECKDEKTLLRVLLSSKSSKYKPFIAQLEASIYEHKKCDLQKIKAALLEQ